MLAKTPYGPLTVDVESFDLPPSFPLVLPVCRELGLAQIVDRWCPMLRSEHVTHGQVIEFLVLHILQAPHRLPLYKLEAWAEEHNVDRLYDCPAQAFNDDRVRRALDAIAPLVSTIEADVVTRALERYHVPVQAVHWDLTHVTFAGVHEGSPIICAGYGDGQLHDKQVHVSLHVTSEDGIPVRHETLAGNAQQAPLASAMLADLQSRLAQSDLIIVSDCAGISYDNIVTYRQAGGHFLGPLQLTPAEREQLAAVPPEAFCELSYRSMGEPRCVYSCHDTTLTLRREKKAAPIVIRALFMHSTSKHQRDAKHRQKQLDKTLRRLEKINGHLNQRQYARFEYARTQVAKAVPQALQDIVGYDLQGPDKQLQLRWWVDENALAHAARGDGRYLLSTDLTEPSAEECVVLYKHQATNEARFRDLNNDLSVHPVFLQSTERICALLFVFILALTVYALLGLCAKRAELEGDHYHKMTARQLIYHFSYNVKVTQLHISGQPPQCQFVLSVDQQYILYRLGFPDPTIFLKQPA